MGDRLATTDMGQKLGGLCPFWKGGAGSSSNTMSPGPRPTIVPSGILIHPAVLPQHRPKIGGCAPWGGAGSKSNTMLPGRGLPSYQVASWSIQLFGHNKHGPKSGSCEGQIWYGRANQRSTLIRQISSEFVHCVGFRWPKTTILGKFWLSGAGPVPTPF